MSAHDTAAALRSKYLCQPGEFPSSPSFRHVLYTPQDFTSEEYHRRNKLAIMVIDGGLGICKRCGAGEIELETWPTCAAYREAQKARRT